MSRKVLLLNAYESGIWGIITWKKALALILKGKAERPVNHHHDYDIRTSNGVFKLPTALVLVEYIHVPYKSMVCNKLNVLKRDKYMCQYCGRKLTNSTGTVDHVLPESRGGKMVWKNVVASCKKCNNKKDNLTLREARTRFDMDLRRKPFVPKRDVMVMIGLDKHLRENWTRWVTDEQGDGFLYDALQDKREVLQ